MRSTSGRASPTTSGSRAGLYAEQHVTVLPGSYLARDVDGHNPGQGRVRISLVASVEDCIEAARTHPSTTR